MPRRPDTGEEIGFGVFAAVPSRSYARMIPGAVATWALWNLRGNVHDTRPVRDVAA